MAKKQPLFFHTLEDAIRVYKQYCKPAQDLEVAVAKAIYTQLGNGFTEAELAEYLLCGSHQWPFRMPCNQQKRANAISALVTAKLWNRQYKDFEDLHNTVIREIGSCKGVGLLTRYDIAKKMSGIFNPPVYPDKVYLQSGALKGAFILTGDSKYTKAPQQVEVKVFEPYLTDLSSIDIENFLCIFKSVLVKGGVDPNIPSVPFCCEFDPRELNPQLRDKVMALAKQLA